MKPKRGLKPVIRSAPDSGRIFDWCLKRGIKMYPVMIRQKEYAVEVDDNGSIRNSYQEKGELYGKEEVERKIEELQRFFYNNFKDT